MKSINLKNLNKHLISIFVFGFITVCIVPFSSASYDSWPKFFTSLATRLWVIVAYVLLTVLFLWIKRFTGSGETFAYKITKAPPDPASEPATETETQAPAVEAPSWRQLPLAIKITRVISIGFLIMFSAYELTTMHFTDFRPRDFANLPDSIFFAIIYLGFINIFIETFIDAILNIKKLPQETRRKARTKFFREMGILLAILAGVYLALWLIHRVWSVKIFDVIAGVLSMGVLFFMMLPRRDSKPELLHVVPSQNPPSQ